MIWLLASLPLAFASMTKVSGPNVGWARYALFFLAGLVGPTSLYIALLNALPWPVESNGGWVRRSLIAAGIALASYATLVFTLVSN